MDKFISQIIQGHGVCVSKANASALNRLAALLEQGKYAQFRTLVEKLDGELKVRDGVESNVSFDLTVDLPNNIFPVLAKRLRTLATGPEFEKFHLSEITTLNQPKYSELDWVIQLVEQPPELKLDYRPDPLGAEWNAVIYHNSTNPEILEAAWNEIMSWSRPANWGEAGQLYVEWETGQVPHNPLEAFDLFLRGRDSVDGSGDYQFPNKVCGYRSSPFKNWNDAVDEAVLAWFEPKTITVITGDLLAETGNEDLDRENFFLYYSLVLALSRTVSADRFAWWIEADHYSEDDALPIDKLEDVGVLWDIFSGLAYADRSLNRSKFDAAFAIQK